MLDMGFSEDMLTIAANTNALKNTWMYSATLGHAGVTNLGKDLLHEPQHIHIAGARDQHADIQQQMILADDEQHKNNMLLKLLADQTEQKVVVFTNTKLMAQQLGDYLVKHLTAGVLHGDMNQDERNFVTQRFRLGKVQILVATDVAARGLDIDGVNLVVNYDLARKGDEYVHRIGRTGRAGQAGLAISFVMANEWNLMASIERYCRVKLKQVIVPGLEGKYKGPKKLKSNGKAAGKKGNHKKKNAKKIAARSPNKVKSDKKVGGGKRPSKPQSSEQQQREGGLVPLKRRNNALKE